MYVFYEFDFVITNTDVQKCPESICNLSENSMYPSYKIVHTVYILDLSYNPMRCDVISRTYKGDILHRLNLDFPFNFLFDLQICLTLLNMISPSTGL